MTRRSWSVWIGFDPREAAAYAVARYSLREFHRHVPVHGLVLPQLQEQGLYTRPTERRLGRLYDVISAHPMSTEFAISRFLVPELERRHGARAASWALFMDCDVLVRGSLNPLIAQLDDAKALYCVQHRYAPAATQKMDGQTQSAYPRKNWSSMMAFNVAHPANAALDVDLVNTLPGRDLHRLCWLDDGEIGALDPVWNWLPGHSDAGDDPQVVHFTEGGPWFEGFRDVPYADHWRAVLTRWAS